MKNKIFITGGLGFIGSHLACELLNKNFDVILFDNLSNSDESALDKINKVCKKKPEFVKGDIRNISDLKKSLSKDIKTVVHMASLKSVPESFKKTSEYYTNNVMGSQNLLSVMKEKNIENILFSSSATVYGPAKYLPIDENHPLEPTNPYAQNKIDIEKLIIDFTKKFNFNSIILRYFNPAGGHESGVLGESIHNNSTNLFPQICRAAKGYSDKLNIFGNDYDTFDGTCIRDFIHISDLSQAHIQSINFIDNNKGLNIFNIGTGQGYSVLQILNTFMDVNKVDIPLNFSKRRKGDLPEIFANPSHANKILKWVSRKTLIDMCKDSWNSCD